MSRFFDSEQVRKSLFELEELQKKIFDDLFQIPFYTSEQKREHLSMMKEFLEKQKVFVFRLSLSEDEEAIQMKNRIMSSAKMFGINPGDDLNIFFEKLEKSINDLEKIIDN